MSSDLTLLPVGGAPAAGLTDSLTSAAGYALSEMADATRRAYRADIRHFSIWCESVGAIALPGDAGDPCGLSGGPRRSPSQGLDHFAPRGGDRLPHKLAGFEPPITESVKSGHVRHPAQARDRAEGQGARHGGGRGEARQARSR